MIDDKFFRQGRKGSANETKTVSRQSFMIARANMEKKISLYQQSFKQPNLDPSNFFDEVEEFFDDENHNREEVERILKLDPKERSTNNIE